MCCRTCAWHLRESCRRGGKVLKRALANLSHLAPERLEALRLALAHKGPLCDLASVSVDVELRQGASAAAVLTVLEMARRLGITAALGGSAEGRGRFCSTQVWVRGQPAFTTLPQPRSSTQALLSAAGIDLPAPLPSLERTAPGPDTRKKLPAQRRNHRKRKAPGDTDGRSTAEP